jgi:hypothetical protein
MDATYDGTLGTAGGPAFAAGLTALAESEKLDAAALAAKAGLPPETVAGVLAGTERIAVPAMARLAKALRLHAVEFMQKSGLLSLEVYAMGLDPLFFLPDGPIRFDARIYMREINPRHAVPERDMLKRSPVLKTLPEDTVLDDVGKLEIQLTYLLRAAVQSMNGSL